MSASISLLRSRRKAVQNIDDSGDESDCSIKDVQKKESIEKDARAIAAINMLTVSMVNQLLEQQGLDPFGKTLASPSLDDGQSWATPVRSASRPSITRSIKENTFSKKSRKSVRFTPDTNRNDCAPDRSCEGDNMELIHTRTVPLSSLKSEPKFTPIRRSKALKAGMLRSLENELAIESADNFVCSNDSFDSPLPIRSLTGNNAAQCESLDYTSLSPAMEVKNKSEEHIIGNQETEAPAFADNKPMLKGSTLFSEKSLNEGSTSASVSKIEQSADKVKSVGESEDQSDKIDLSNETPVKPKWTHHFDPTSPEYMSPFLKTLLEERAEQSQGRELSKSFSSTKDSEDQKLSILKGVIAFVEVIRADEDRSSGFRWKLKQLGAQVEENFTKKVTHVIFQEGLLSTYRKAKESNVHLVSAFWVMACDESASRVPEDKYPIDEEDKYSTLAPLKKYIRRPKLLSPSLGDGDDEKRLARRLQAIKRRSMKIESALCADFDTNDTNVAHPSKMIADCRTPQNSKRASFGKKSAGTASGGCSTFMAAWLTGKKKVDSEKHNGSPPSSESVTSKVRTRSPKKKPAKVCPEKLKTSAFVSPVKKSSSRSVSSPAKTKPSSSATVKRSFAAVDSSDKEHLSSELFNSPAKKKPSSRIVDSPAKTKISSRHDDSPSKGRSSSKSTDSPAKTKQSSRSFDFSAKPKPSSKSIDSLANTEPSSRQFDSSAKIKPSLKLSETLKSTSIVSPVRSKSIHKSFVSPKVRKHGSDKVGCSLVKSSSLLPKCSATSKASERVLRSTPKKSDNALRSNVSFTTEEDKMPQVESLPASIGVKCLPDYLSANKASPAKRSPSKAFTDHWESPSYTITDDAPTPSISVDDSKPQDFETPWKKAHMDLTHQKVVTETKAKNLSRDSCPEKSAVSKPLTIPKPASKRSKSEKKKQSSRGNAAKGKFNDKSQTVMTSHFRPLNVTKKKEKVVTSEGSRKAPVDTNESAASSKDFMQTKPPQTSQERDAVLPSVYPLVVDNPSDEIGSERPFFCPLSEETEGVFPEESQMFSSKVEGVNEEPRMMSDVRAESKTSADSCEKLDDFDETKKVWVLLNEEAATNVSEDPLMTEELMTSADVSKEPMEVGYVSEKQLALVDSEKEPLQASDDCQKLITGDTHEMFVESAGVCEEKIADSHKELVDDTDFCEDMLVSDDAVQGSMKTALVSEEQTASTVLQVESLKAIDVCEDKSVSNDGVEIVKDTFVSEEQTAAADKQEESMKGVDVCEDKLVTGGAFGEPVKTVDSFSEVQTGALEESTEVAGLCGDKTVNAFREPVSTSDVCKEQTIVADVLEESTKAMEDVKDNLEHVHNSYALGKQTASTADAFEERMNVSDNSPNKIANGDSKQYMNDSEICKEQTANVLEEPLKTTDFSDVQTASSSSLGEQPSTTDMSPDKSSGYLSNVEQDGSCDSLSSQGWTSHETCRKRARKSIKPINKPCHYRTRRSMRLVTSVVTD